MIETAKGKTLRKGDLIEDRGVVYKIYWIGPHECMGGLLAAELFYAGTYAKAISIEPEKLYRVRRVL
jgi:hypothetical protein